MPTFEQQVAMAVRSNKEYQKRVKALAKNSFERKKTLMMHEFTSHPVTQELSNEESPNISSTLGGYGNLFGFIGFNAGYDPIGPVEERLQELVELLSVSFNVSGGSITIKYNVPSLDDFGDVAQYQGWREGGNWLKGIEAGIAGLGSFRTTLGEEDKGRSGVGFQMKGKSKSLGAAKNRFNNTKYMSSIINNFKGAMENI